MGERGRGLFPGGSADKHTSSSSRGGLTILTTIVPLDGSLTWFFACAASFSLASSCASPSSLRYFSICLQYLTSSFKNLLPSLLMCSIFSHTSSAIDRVGISSMPSSCKSLTNKIKCGTHLGAPRRFLNKRMFAFDKVMADSKIAQFDSTLVRIGPSPSHC